MNRIQKFAGQSGQMFILLVCLHPFIYLPKLTVSSYSTERLKTQGDRWRERQTDRQADRDRERPYTCLSAICWCVFVNVCSVHASVFHCICCCICRFHVDLFSRNRRWSTGQTTVNKWSLLRYRIPLNQWSTDPSRNVQNKYPPPPNSTIRPSNRIYCGRI